MFEYCRLYVGQHQSLERLLSELLRFEYRRVDEVLSPGDVAVHGGNLDLFPGTFESPLRVEFDAARVISIRSFNPKTFETLDRHTMVVVLPRRVHAKVAAEIPFEASIDLKKGDAIVHLEHGIGRFLGRVTLPGKEGEDAQENMVLEYAGNDRLYVPLTQLHLVQKYMGFGSGKPALHTLGGTAWARAKAKAFAGAWSYANSLLELQAKRLAVRGFGFPKDHEWQSQFEAAFPFRETPDQLRTTNEVKQDMEQARPMDRLLVGDVGYGKTEVALRAAFKAVVSQKQVAFLVPTTILAYQHYRSFTRRLKDFPVTVQMLTRFETDHEQAVIMEQVAKGSCDILIGTHRLLSGDVRFHDLGLLVVDEEQRFGVADKERLKQWRSQVDVLTLSATPIPRTLYLALVGSRDLSLIATPPENRHPIDTQVVEEDDSSIQRWIRRELSRQGQVYVVHNRVFSIHRVALRIGRLVPEAKIGIAHGQMHENELQEVMVAFMEGRLDVLVSTTIIESGIDIPNANTLIVLGAEAFGLADLYQLRGRVGRFTRHAFAYFVTSKSPILTEQARERLRVIVQHTALGSGFKIAMEDLMIRGAGNLLGLEQSGHITSVGFDLYCRLLREAVERIRSRE